MKVMVTRFVKCAEADNVVMEYVSASDDVDGKAMVVEGEWMSSIT